MTTLPVLESRISKLTSTLGELKALRSMEQKRLNQVRQELSLAKDKARKLEGVQNLLRDLTDKLISQEIKPIQDFVNFGISYIFKEKDLELLIEKKESASGLKYEIVLREGKFKAKLKDSFGGSVSEIASFMLRIGFIRRLGKEPLIVLDEFFTGLDARSRTRFIELVKILCERLNFKIFLITQQEDFKDGADRVLFAYPTLDGVKIKEASSTAIPIQGGLDAE